MERLKIYEVNKRSLSEHLVKFEKLHYNEKEKLIKLLDKTKKILLKEIKTELLKSHIGEVIYTKKGMNKIMTRKSILHINSLSNNIII